MHVSCLTALPTKNKNSAEKIVDFPIGTVAISDLHLFPIEKSLFCNLNYKNFAQKQQN